MKEQPITYDTAILAREKGFDWQCKDYHLNDQSVIHASTLVRNTNLANGCYSAPTQSHLIKWFREEHNIDASITSLANIDLYVENSTLNKMYTCRVDNWNVTWSVHDGTGAVMPEHYHFEHKIYEEALELGLIKALELIKTKN